MKSSLLIDLFLPLGFLLWSLLGSVEGHEHEHEHGHKHDQEELGHQDSGGNSVDTMEGLEQKWGLEVGRSLIFVSVQTLELPVCLHSACHRYCLYFYDGNF